MQFSIKPIQSEKANAVSEKRNCYTFKVSPDANKHQVKMLVEQIYGVKVKAVNTINYAGKNKSRYTKSGLVRGKADAFKKAYVTLAEGETIDFYSNI